MNSVKKEIVGWYSKLKDQTNTCKVLTAEKLYSKAITGRVCSQEEVIKHLIGSIMDKIDLNMRRDIDEVYYRFNTPITSSHSEKLRTELEILGYTVKYMSRVSCIITWEMK